MPPNPLTQKVMGCEGNDLVKIHKFLGIQSYANYHKTYWPRNGRLHGRRHKKVTRTALHILRKIQPKYNNNKLMKGKALRKHSLHEKTAASVLLKLFISGNEWCHTTDAP